MKNSCDQCLECPSCNIPMTKRMSDNKYFYACGYCYYDTNVIKFACAKESDLDSLVIQLKDSQTKGYLKKLYDHNLLKLKQNENLITSSSSFTAAGTYINNK